MLKNRFYKGNPWNKNEVQLALFQKHQIGYSSSASSFIFTRQKLAENIYS